MTFQEITNNQPLLDRLSQIASSGQVHHAFLFEGPASADKMMVAKAFAQSLLCKTSPGVGCGHCSICHKIQNENHIDITITRPGKAESSKAISVKDADVEVLIDRLKKKPYDGERNIGILEGADTMTPRAGNRLLKTLEEPPQGTVILLLCENALLLPATIRSRCIQYRIMPFHTENNEEIFRQAKDLAEAMAQKVPFYQLKLQLDGLKGDKGDALQLLDALENFYGEALRGHGEGRSQMKQEQVREAIHAIEMAKQDIKRNIGVRYALMEMVLRIGG